MHTAHWRFYVTALYKFTCYFTFLHPTQLIVVWALTHNHLLDQENRLYSHETMCCQWTPNVQWSSTRDRRSSITRAKWKSLIHESCEFGIWCDSWHFCTILHICCTFASKSINFLCKNSLTSHTGPIMTTLIIIWSCNTRLPTGIL